jgi:hypothetical protein
VVLTLLFVLIAGVAGWFGVGLLTDRVEATPPTSTSSPAPPPGFRVGDCAMPDPQAPKRTLPVDCTDGRATVTVLTTADLRSSGGYPNCPVGTDDLFMSPAADGTMSVAVCVRNRSEDHPGDPGRGGGTLVVGDCVRDDNAITEVECAREGAQKVLGLVTTATECPPGTVRPLDLRFGFEGPYKIICVRPV